MSIPFTQYTRPNGHPRSESIDRPAEIEALALKVIEAGGRFECEVLWIGEVSFEVVRERADGEVETLASTICLNGSEVPDAVDRLVRAAYARISNVTMVDGWQP